jgi:hypothetical protein
MYRLCQRIARSIRIWVWLSQPIRARQVTHTSYDSRCSVRHLPRGFCYNFRKRSDCAYVRTCRQAGYAGFWLVLHANFFSRPSSLSFWAHFGGRLAGRACPSLLWDAHARLKHFTAGSEVFKPSHPASGTSHTQIETRRCRHPFHKHMLLFRVSSPSSSSAVLLGLSACV